MNSDPELQETLAQYRAAMTAQVFDPADRNPQALASHLSLLEALAAMESASVAAFDLAERRYVFLRTRWREVLGLPASAPAEQGPEFVLAALHPDDRIPYLRGATRVMRHLLSLPSAERKSFTSLYDYRVQRGDGTWTRLLQKGSVLELDARGNIWVVLATVEPSRIRDLAVPIRCGLRHRSSGAFAVFADEERSVLPTLSPRQREILSYVARGLASADIARILGLSVHTVNTHRRHILDRLQATTSAEAVAFAADSDLL